MAKGSVKTNFIYNTMYQILAILLPLITTPYISRILGAEGIGEYSYSYSVARYFVLFAMLGINNYGNRSIATVRDDEEKLSQTFSSIYVMQIFTAVASFVVYAVYCKFTDAGYMSYVLMLYVLSSVFDISWFYFGIEKFKLTVVRNTIIKLLSVVCIFIFVNDQNDRYVYGFILAISFLLSQLAVWPFLHKYTKFTRPSIADVIKHIKPNLILFVPVIAVSLYKTMDKIMLGNLSNLSEVGFYENSEKIIDIPLAFVTSLGTVMLPRMSNMMAHNQEKESYRYISLSILFAAFISTSMSFGIMGVCSEFVPIFFGSGYDACVMILLVLCPSTIFTALANVIRTQFLIPMQEDKSYIISVFLGAATNLIANFIFIPQFQATGAALGTLLAEAVVFIVQFIAVKKEINLIEPVCNSLLFVASGFVMFLILYFIDFSYMPQIFALLLKVVIGAIIYFVVLLLILLIKKYVLKKEGILSLDLLSLYAKNLLKDIGKHGK